MASSPWKRPAALEAGALRLNGHRSRTALGHRPQGAGRGHGQDRCGVRGRAFGARYALRPSARFPSPASIRPPARCGPASSTSPGRWKRWSGWRCCGWRSWTRSTMAHQGLLDRTAEAVAEGARSLERGTGQVVRDNGVAIDKLVNGEIAAVRISLEMLSDVNMAGAVMIEASNVQDAGADPGTAKRFDTVARHLAGGLKQLPQSADSRRRRYPGECPAGLWPWRRQPVRHAQEGAVRMLPSGEAERRSSGQPPSGHPARHGGTQRPARIAAVADGRRCVLQSGDRQFQDDRAGRQAGRRSGRQRGGDAPRRPWNCAARRTCWRD